MKNFVTLLALLLSLPTPLAHAGYEAGAANQVLRVPSGGGRPQYGAVDVSQAAAITGQLPVAKGGTGSSSLTSGGLVVGAGASAPTALSPGAVNSVVKVAGSSWQAIPWIPPTQQIFLSGSGTYNKDYTFIISSGSATVGATYTNNSVTFTVYATVSSATMVVMSGSGAPASSGTLTKASGTGDSTLTFSAAVAPVYLHVQAVGGGGGGAGGGPSAATASTGGTTTFGSSLITCPGGTGGSGNAGPGGNGATPTALGTGAIGLSQKGTQGTPGSTSPTPAGNGGSSPYFGGGATGSVAGAGGVDGQPNSGGGGQGGSASGGTVTGGGGGSGAFVDAIISSPSATYAYAVGAGGAASAGSGGSGPQAGGNGAAGQIIVKEFYQ